jgi:hypothetical protein
MEQTTIENEKNNLDKKLLKYTFDGTGKEDAVETLGRFLKDCNEKDYGRKVTISDIIARGIRKLDIKDMELLQEQSMGLKDSLRQKYKTEKGVEATEDDFVRWLLEEYSPKQKKKLN